MKFDFAGIRPNSVDDAPGVFRDNISLSLGNFIGEYTPYLGNVMAQIVSDFSDYPVENFLLIVAGVSDELERIKKEGKSDSPLADVEGVCSFQLLFIAVATLLTPKDLSAGR